VTRTLSEYPEIIVVLGGGVRADGSPTRSTLERPVGAAALARSLPHAAIICSGSHGVGHRPTRSEAALMADVLTANGVEPERIFLEDESRDTIGNAVHVAERYLASIAPRPIHLVTSPFHLARSVETFGLVLGPAWKITGHASGTDTVDPERARTELRFAEQTRLFLDGTRPGDIAAIADKLRRRDELR